MTDSSKFHIGTSGWNYDHWAGPFYPEDLSQDEWLEFYMQHFTTVEINNSFYQLPDEKTLQSWYDQTPDDFTFAVKASRYITHMKKLKEPKESLQNFLDRVSLLQDKLGIILFQLPPNWNFNEERLRSFLGLLPDNYNYTMEFRDKSWINETTYEILHENNIAFCIYELAGYVSPMEVTADTVYIRLHGPSENKYQGKYDSETLHDWAESIREWTENGKEVYCYFDNDQSGYATMNAERLQKLLDK